MTPAGYYTPDGEFTHFNLPSLTGPVATSTNGNTGGAGCEGTGGSNFADRAKLETHFSKHGKEFKGAYNNADDYLQGARDAMKNGTKVQYNYKGEVRSGYVKFMGNTSKGQAKFEFVGTNAAGDITTYHVESGKSFWKMLNGENIPEINPVN